MIKTTSSVLSTHGGGVDAQLQLHTGGFRPLPGDSSSSFFSSSFPLALMEAAVCHRSPGVNLLFVILSMLNIKMSRTPTRVSLSGGLAAFSAGLFGVNCDDSMD